MKKELIDRYIDHIREKAEQPLVTANFGDNWKEYAKDALSHNELIEIAWKQGRYAILLEWSLRKQLENETTERERERLKRLMSQLK